MGYLKLSNGYCALSNGYRSLYDEEDKPIKEAVRNPVYKPLTAKAKLANPLIAVPEQPQLMYNEYKNNPKQVVRKKATKLGRMN